MYLFLVGKVRTDLFGFILTYLPLIQRWTLAQNFLEKP